MLALQRIKSKPYGLEPASEVPAAPNTLMASVLLGRSYYTVKFLSAAAMSRMVPTGESAMLCRNRTGTAESRDIRFLTLQLLLLFHTYTQTKWLIVPGEILLFICRIIGAS